MVLARHLQEDYRCRASFRDALAKGQAKEQ